MPNAIEVLLWATFGGMFCELLHWVGIRRNKHFPLYARSVKYWVITLMLVIAGGIFAVAVSLSGLTVTALSAIIMGYSTPSLVQKLAKAFPPPRLGSGEDNLPPSTYQFLVS